MLDHGHPIGVVTIADLVGTPGHVPSPDTSVTDVMRHECVDVDPGSGTEETLRRYGEAAWKSLYRRHPGAAETVARRRRAFG